MRNRWAGLQPAGRVRCLLPVLTAGVLLSAASPSSAQSAPPVSLGAGLQTSFVSTSPDGGDSQDLELARTDLDLLGLLQEKTKGNLTGDEERLLTQALTDLRMRYVEVTSR